ncbi:MAG TPA: YSC84-related protein [Caulobacteraceae bacterium]|jgi:lipid-binding SYLF domain-containing protein
MDTNETPASPASDRRLVLIGLTAAAALASLAGGADAASRGEINANADAAMSHLFEFSPRARDLADHARGVLIFPHIVKAGFIFGGAGGEGVLRIGGRSVAYFSLGAASFGFQAGVKEYSLAMFFMTRSALDFLRNSQGWALGGGPEIVVIDQGMAAGLNTTSLSQPVYAMVFHQRGLEGGISLSGSKITHIHPD